MQCVSVARRSLLRRVVQKRRAKLISLFAREKEIGKNSNEIQTHLTCSFKRFTFIIWEYAIKLPQLKYQLVNH